MLKKITALMLAASVMIIAAAAVRSFSSNWTKRFPPKKAEPKQAKAPAPVEKKNIELLPYSGTRLITGEEAAALSDQELRIARCEITARHGKRVCSEKTKEYFETISWYHPSSDYDSASLSDIEKENLEILYKEELGRKQAAEESSFSYDDLAGKWISIDENPEDDYVPKNTTLIEIKERDGAFYYVYSFVATPICFTPGESVEKGESHRIFSDATTGHVTLDEDTGTLTLYFRPSGEMALYTYKYDVMSDCLILTDDDDYQETLIKDDDFEY